MDLRSVLQLPRDAKATISLIGTAISPIPLDRHSPRQSEVVVIGRQLSDNTLSTFSYDERGLRKQAYHHREAGAVSQITYEYDAAGRRTAEVQAHHGRVWRLQHRLDAVGNRSEADNIPDSLVYKLHRMATGGASDWLDEISKTYAKDQRNCIIDFLDEMSRIEWRHQVPDLAADAASLLRKIF